MPTQAATVCRGLERTEEWRRQQTTTMVLIEQGQHGPDFLSVGLTESRNIGFKVFKGDGALQQQIEARTQTGVA